MKNGGVTPSVAVPGVTHPSDANVCTPVLQCFSPLSFLYIAAW